MNHHKGVSWAMGDKVYRRRKAEGRKWDEKCKTPGSTPSLKDADDIR